MIHKAKAQTEVGLFFANSVDAGFHQLQSFCELLEDYLKAGEKIIITLEAQVGMNENKENLHALSARRLHSVENFFAFYKNGIFQPWLAGKDLQIVREYIAPSQHKGIIDTSHFEINKARSRKVVIRKVEIKGTK